MTKKSTKTTIHAIGGKNGASCTEILALLNEYVDGGVDPAVCKEFESHLAQCNPCRVVVDNVRKTITLYRRDELCELPSGFQKRLHAELRNHWKDTGPGKKPAKKR
jgi:hypothetical protein